VGTKLPPRAQKPAEPHPSQSYRRTAADFPDALRVEVDAVKCVSVEGDNATIVFRSGAKSYCLLIGFGRLWNLSPQIKRVLEEMSEGG
jgi:hypothetical protein